MALWEMNREPFSIRKDNSHYFVYVLGVYVSSQKKVIPGDCVKGSPNMFFLCPLLAFLSLSNAKVIDCTKASASSFKINSLSLSPPDHASPGENVTLGLLYTNPFLVTDGTVTTSVTYNFIPLTPSVEPFCTSVFCPLQPGQHDGGVSFAFPAGLSGSLVTKIVWTVTNIDVLCIQLTLKAMSKALTKPMVRLF